MSEVMVPLTTLSKLNLAQVKGVESKITINGAEEFKQELVRARAVESLATTVGNMGSNADLERFKFGLTIEW